nr:hypothetical protein [Tanacetum cinerariifolium]
MTTSPANNSVFRGFFEKKKLTGPNFIDWYRQLRIVLSIEDKLNHLEQPIPPAPVALAGQHVAPKILVAHTNSIKGSKEIEEGQSVSSYVLKMKGYIDNLECLGHPVTLGLGVSMILIGLRKEYDSFVKNYNMHIIGKIVNELHAMLKLHEQTLPKNNAPALHAIRADKVQKYLAELLKKKKNAASGAGDSGIFVIELNTILNRSWIYDTGCGTYICNTMQCLRASRKLKPGALSLYVGNGQREAFEAIGVFYLCLSSGLEIVLNNCHYAPSIIRGVIYVSHLDGIFKINLSNSYTNESSIYAISNKRAKLDLDSALLWHCRLGHISKKRIEKLQHDGLLNSTDLKAFEKCVSCMSGKMARKPYTHQVERAKDLLGLIHTNVVYDVLRNSPFFRAFQVTADIPEIYMQEFWATAKLHHNSIRFKMDTKKSVLNLEAFREMLHISPRIPNQSFAELPSEEEILEFLRYLRCSHVIQHLTDVNINKLYQPWRSFDSVINKCLTGKSSGIDSFRLSQAQILWGFYHRINIDFAYLIWEDFVYQVEHKNQKRSNEMYYPRFTKVIIDYFMTRKPSILRQNRINWHYVRDDVLFSTIKVVSKHQTTQQYGAILSIELTTDEIRNSKAYKEYYACVTGEAAPKPKASAKKKKGNSASSTTPPTLTPTTTVVSALRLSATAKGKQPARAITPTEPTDVERTEAEQLKIALKRSRQETHVSQQCGLGTDEGTGSRPGVPDVPSDDSEEELSWNSSDDKVGDEHTKGREESERDKTDESDDGKDDDDDETVKAGSESDKYDDDNDDEEEPAKNDDEDTESGKGGDE